MPFSLAVVALVAAFTWVVQPLAGRVWVPPFAAGVLALGVWHAVRAGDWGWSTRALLPGLAASAVFTAAMAVALFVASEASGTRPDRPILLLDALAPGAAWIVLWGGAQQWLLQTTFLREAESARTRRPAIVAAALFGALHLPNPFLTTVTAVSAVGWCAIYRRYPNVLPLALSHAAGTLVVEALFDASVTGRLRVGYSYLQLGP